MTQKVLTNRKTSKLAAAPARTKKVVSDFPISLYKETDEVAAEMHMSRSAIIRRAVEDLLKARRHKQLESEIDEYFRDHADFERRIMDDFRHVDSEGR
jgi:metal-responsive CopG/Arc/MetJ family transcriptional regulator